MNAKRMTEEKQRGLGGPASRILFGRGSAAVFSILFVAYIARELPKSTVALVAIQSTTVMLACVLSELGLRYCVLREATLTIHAGDIPQSVRDTIGPSTLIRLIAAFFLTLIYGGAGLLAMPLLQKTFPQLDMPLILLFLSLHLFFKCAQTIMTPIYFVMDRFGSDSFLDSVTALLEKILAVIAYLVFDSQDAFFLGFSLGPAFILCITLWQLRLVLRHIRPSQLRLDDALNRLKEYFPSYSRQFYRQGLRQFDRILIATMLPIDQMANYHIARQGSSYLKHVIRAFADPLTVRLSEEHTETHRKKLTRTYLFYTVGIPLVAAAFGPWLIQLIGGEKFADNWFILVILCLSYVFYGFSELQLSFLTILGKGDESTRMDAIAGLSGVVATFVLITLYGEYGMAWGQLIAYSVLWLGGRRITRNLLRSHSSSNATLE